MPKIGLSRLLFLVALALIIVMPLRWWVVEPITIASASMEPTLPTGGRFIQDKITLRFRPVRRGEIVVFNSPIGEGYELIKRVIALPGETVEIREKKVFIGGIELEEPYVRHSRAGERLEGDWLGPLVVPPDKFFVLGDNRDESKDSSVWKDPETGKPVYFIKQRNLMGLVRGG